MALIHGNNETVAGIYSATFVLRAGCDSTSNVTLIVNPASAVSFNEDVISGCDALTVTFTNTASGSLTDCLWTMSDGTTLNGCGSVSTTFQNGGLYDVTLTTAFINGCTSTETYIDFINVEDNPIAAFNPSSSTLSVFNSGVLFINNSSVVVSYLRGFGDSSATST